jgi:asparagine synthase (glutamine-hydrolysing)
MSAQSAPIGSYYRLQGKDSWGMLRCAEYRDRPFHADQLHLDIFYRGKAVILDPGTYAYNPQTGDDWDNALTGTAVHNTVLLDGKDQMQRAGRFLWLDWAQAKVHSQDSSSVEAEHNGYAPVVHRRNVKVEGDRWLVTDDITGSGEHEIELHWLIADSEWNFAKNTLEVGKCRVQVEGSSTQSIRLIRGGERIAGAGSSSVDRYRGWYSPTYRVKIPAISMVSTIRAALPVRVTTEISFSS